MTRFNVILLLFGMLPVSILAIIRGYQAHSPYLFVMGVVGAVIAIFFGIVILRILRSVNKKSK